MPSTYTIALRRPFGSTILVPFTSQESDDALAAIKASAAARAFATQYYHMSPSKGDTTRFNVMGEDYLGGTDHTQFWLFPTDISTKYGDRSIDDWWAWSTNGTVVLEPDEALTIFVQDEPEGYPVGESEAPWSRNTRTHEELDAELDEWMAIVDTP